MLAIFVVWKYDCISMRRKHDDPQQLILNFIESYQANHQRPPTVREIQDKMGYKSPRAVSYFLEKLEKASLIVRKSRSRGIFLKAGRNINRPVMLPLFDTIPAGMADPIIPESSDHLTLDASLFGSSVPENCYAIRVRGSGMEEASILDGDIGVMEVREAKPGDVVAALIEGETVLKRLVEEDGRLFLKAEHLEYRDLLPIDLVAIHGVLVGLIRKVGS